MKSTRCRPAAYIPVLLLLWAAVWPSPAVAHKITVFAWVEEDMVYTRSRMAGGKGVNEGDVVVSDIKGNRLLQGKTDENGEFSFKLPQPPPFVVSVNAGMGHSAEWTITQNEPDAFSANGKPEIPEPDSASKTEPASPPLSVETPADCISPEALEPALEKALDKKLKPVMAALADMHQTGPSLGDIIGGIGYIIGLVGLAAYLKNRPTSDSRRNRK